MQVVLFISLVFITVECVWCTNVDQTCDEQGVCINVPKVKISKDANEFGRPPDVSADKCLDRHTKCIEYESWGECEKNPGWMIVNCPASCNACHLLDPKVRCSRSNLNISEELFFKPGEMNAMFENIVPTFGDRYDVNIVSTSPWVVTIDNFLTDQEINALIETVEGGWERSTDTGTANAYGETGRILSQSRTSSNAWCRAACESHPDVISVVNKIEEVTGVPSENYESFQVLRYEHGQKYAAHHDASATQTRLSCGARMLTFFLYLSDVEEGGETAFPSLGISVKPRRGSALLWPSTLDEDPMAIDSRTTHEAKAVITGTKLAANAWIHTNNFRKSNLWGCTGTFDQL